MSKNTRTNTGAFDQNQPDDSTANGRRNSGDKNRDRKIYSYLLYLSGIKSNPQDIDEGDIAKKWGHSDNRTFVRRVINNLYPNIAKKKSAKSDALPALSLNKLVDILKAIEDYWEKEAKNFKPSDGQSMPEFLRDVDKVRAIHKYCELSREERTKLNLSVDFDIYVKENFINEIISDNYTTVGDIQNSKHSQKTKATTEAYIDNLIKIVIEEELKVHWTDKTYKITEIIEKVKNEIKAIEM
jgi:hypothetical protein